ncbi:MAG TPA: hypothetical protein VF711_09955, partial [Acidimicrobiales bacterium]
MSSSRGADNGPPGEPVELSTTHRHRPHPAEPDAELLRIPPARRRANRNLPAPLSSFIGRQGELAALIALLAEARLITLAGTGGIGKTRLALEVASLWADGHHDGAWLVELAPVSDPSVVPEAVLAEVVGSSPGNGQAVHDLVGHLHDREGLLVLDNCEHLIEACATLVRELLDPCPGLRILATSREPLGITGEKVWWVQSLPVPSAADVDSTSLGANEAVRLFVERARDTSPDFALTVDVAPAVAEICRRLDGLPLAIELAAARRGVLSPTEILSRLDDRFRLLTGGSPSGVSRHQTLQAAFEWSHDLLSAEEATFLRRSSVFAGGWSLEAAEHVCSGEAVLPERVLDVLGALVAKSLVVADHGSRVTRYRLLETIRSFARAKLDEASETEAMLARHARWCLLRAEQADTGRAGKTDEAWLQHLDDDHDNFRAALAWARDHDDVETWLRLANALTWFWQTRGYLREGLDWLRAGVAAGNGAPADVRAKAMRSAGRLVHMLGDHRSG